MRGVPAGFRDDGAMSARPPRTPLLRGKAGGGSSAAATVRPSVPPQAPRGSRTDLALRAEGAGGAGKGPREARRG